MRTRDEINDLMDKAAEGINEGSRFPGMSYEEGIRAAIEWLTEENDEHPLDED
jgi:hypothetical protein